MSKVVFQTLTVEPKAAHEVIVMPHFGDVIGENGDVIIPSSDEGDWQVMDDVPYKRPIIEIYGYKNLLKRRDATCKIIYTSLGKTSNRYIATEAVYLAPENCQRELYQGAFRDWESRQDVFSGKAVELISKIAGVDIFSNKWFGWTGRAHIATWSLNKFNGIWHYIAGYNTSGVIPAGQTVDLGDPTSFTDQEAYEGLLAMIDKQDEILYNIDDSEKAFYIDKKWAKKAWRYLRSIGYDEATSKAANMPASFFVEDIEVKPKPWNPLVAAIMGAEGNLGILTLRGNFLYATDSAYGSGPKSDGPALKVWYSEDDDVTRWQWHHKGGTEMGAPQHSVIATTTALLAAL